MGLKDREEGFLTPSSIVQMMGLVFSILFCALLFSLVIRPAAERYKVAEELGVEENMTTVGGIAVILKDYEQQACCTLMCWVLMILAYKAFLVNAEKSILLREERHQERGYAQDALLTYPSENEITPSTAEKSIDHLLTAVQKDATLDNKLFPHLLLKGLQRFQLSGSVQEASDVVKGRIDVAAERLDSELSIIRYIAWAIPSIGFIGTVRGIGAALADADQAIEGDISGVTSSLGLAFNSTLVALFISIFLMYFIHSLQSRQEGTILAIETFCREYLLDRLRLS